MKASSSPGPLSLSVPADITASLKGHRAGHLSITVRDSGTVPLHITASAGNFGPDAHAAGWVTGIYPAVFTIRPGHSRTVTVVVKMPTTATGPGIADVKFAAAPASNAGQLRVGIGAVTAVKIVHPGEAVPLAKASPMILPPPAPKSDVLLPAALAVAFLALVIGATALGSVLWRRRRRRGRLILHAVPTAPRAPRRGSHRGHRRMAG